MAALLPFFITLQITLALFMALHDWIHIPPFTDIPRLKASHTFSERMLSAIINTTAVIIPLTITIFYSSSMFPFWARITISCLYGLLTLGTLAAWWMPYFFGSSEAHKTGFKEYESTHHFVPKRGTNVVPNTLHVIMHIQVWLCFGLSFFL